MSEQDERDFIESVFLGVAKQIHQNGVPKQPFIINSFSPDSHSIFICIWPATSPDGEWKTKALRVPNRGFEPSEQKKERSVER